MEDNSAPLPANGGRSRDLFHKFVNENVFSLWAIYNKSLKDCSLGKQLILLPSTPPRQTLRFSGNKIKTESIRKLSNFNFQWTKTLYQNNFISRAIDVVIYL